MIRVILCTVLVVLTSSAADGRESDFEEIPVFADSGLRTNESAREAAVWSHEVRVPGAPWINVAFDEVSLSADV